MKQIFSSVILGLLLSTSSVLAGPSPSPTPSQALGPDASLAELKAGNQRFVSEKANACSNTTASRAATADSQAPNAIILSCSDSRVPPEQVFDQQLGQIFVVRLAGNIINDDAIASIEYAVANFGSHLIVVMGHESCGAIDSALKVPQGTDAGSPSLNVLLSQIRANLGSASFPADPKNRQPVMKNVDAVATELLLRSTILSDAVAKGQLKIQDAIYDLANGQVDFFDSSSVGK